MHLKIVDFPLKPVVVGVLLICSVLTLTSYMLDRANPNAIHKLQLEENAKRLANTTWKIKYYDCVNCDGRGDDLSLYDNGEGMFENTPVAWEIKDDSVSIHAKSDMGCQFPGIMLSDENMMFGTNLCSGDERAARFVATKIRTGDSDENTGEAPNSSNLVNVLDKTYMFKRGFEPVFGFRKVDCIIVHSSFCVNSNNPFDLYCVLAEYKRHGVAAHYLIDREGKVHRLVNESNIAFHAGNGRMPDGYNAINRRSLGIELINSETEGPTEAQYAALANLVKNIKSRHNIRYIKGHSQVSPGRKTDPWKFNWKLFFSSITDDVTP